MSLLSYLNTKTDFYIQHSVRISYITKLTSVNNEVIFICKKENNSAINSIKINANNDCLDTSTIGSPLKDVCEIDTENISFDLESIKNHTNIIEDYQSISKIEAVHILTDVINSDQLKFENNSIWVLCSEENDNTVLLEINSKQNYNSRGFVKYVGFCNMKNINVNELFAKHFSFINNTKEVSTEIDTFFKLNKNITLKLSQKYESTNVSLTNYSNSKIILYQSIEIDDDNSILKQLWDQLILLHKLKEHIVKCIDTDEDEHSLHYCEMGSEFEIFKQKITKIFIGSYILKNEAPNDINNTENQDLSSVISEILNMDYIDITDKLFDILQTCSYNKLKPIFCFIFQYVANHTVLNMPINSNRLSILIQDVSQRRNGIPYLTNLEIYSMFLDIGLEKITKQYELIFTKAKICSLYDFNLTEIVKNKNISVKQTTYPLIGTQTSNEKIKDERKTLLYRKQSSAIPIDDIIKEYSFFNRKEINSTLNKLANIHIVVEHLLLIQNHLKLNSFHSSIVQQLLQRTPITFDKFLTMKNDKLELLLYDTSIMLELANKDLSAKRISMYSQNKFKNVSNVYYYSLDSILPVKNLPKCAQENETNDKYMCLHYLKLDSKK